MQSLRINLCPARGRKLAFFCEVNIICRINLCPARGRKQIQHQFSYEIRRRINLCPARGRKHKDSSLKSGFEFESIYAPQGDGNSLMLLSNVKGILENQSMPRKGTETSYRVHSCTSCKRINLCPARGRKHFKAFLFFNTQPESIYAP